MKSKSLLFDNCSRYKNISESKTTLKNDFMLFCNHMAKPTYRQYWQWQKMFTNHFGVKKKSFTIKRNPDEDQKNQRQRDRERESEKERGRERKKYLFCYRHSLSLISQIKGPSLTYGVVAMSSQGWSVAMFTSGSSRRGELSNIISVIGWFG